MPMNATLWKLLLRTFILPFRSRASARKYGEIWTEQGSPLATTMMSLAQRLQQTLQNDGVEAIVQVGSSYGEPSMSQALDEIKRAQCDEVAVIPLYPQTAFSTTSVVVDQLEAALKQVNLSIPVHVVRGYADEPAYLNAIAESIHAAGFDASRGDRLLFAFHSIPLVDIQNGDTYPIQVEETVNAVAERLSLASHEWTLGYQSRFDKGRTWLSPFTAEAINRLEQSDSIGRLFVVAPNFSIDCLETLYEIDRELRKSYCAEGDVKRSTHDFVYVPCLNDSDAHVRVLQSLLLYIHRHDVTDD